MSINNRTSTPGASMTAQYRCLHCLVSVWRGGGAATFGKHLANYHGIDVGPFPSVVHVDSDGHVVDWEGSPVVERVKGRKVPVEAPTTGVDGWMRTVADRVHHKDAVKR